MFSGNSKNLKILDNRQAKSNKFDFRSDQPYGLKNLGNSCYINAVIQSLATCAIFNTFLMNSLSHDNCELVNCVHCSLRNCFQDMKLKSKIVNPTAQIIALLNKISSGSLLPGRQEDAHEFLTSLIISLQEESKTSSTLFEGTLLSRICCYFCGTISAKIDPVVDISLDISKASTLENALAEYCEIEALTGHNAFECSTCKKGVSLAHKCLRLQHTPEILIFQLKRFSFNASSKDSPGNSNGNGGGSSRSSKISRLVEFPEFLDMDPFIYRKQDDDNGSSCSGDNTDVEEDEVQIPALRTSPRRKQQTAPSTPPLSTIYELRSLVVHTGRSPHSGHYVAYVRRGESWYRLDDLHVGRVSLQEVLAQRAYILFYQRVSTTTNNNNNTNIIECSNNGGLLTGLSRRAQYKQQQQQQQSIFNINNHNQNNNKNNGFSDVVSSSSSSGGGVRLFDRSSIYASNKATNIKSTATVINTTNKDIKHNKHITNNINTNKKRLRSNDKNTNNDTNNNNNNDINNNSDVTSIDDCSQSTVGTANSSSNINYYSNSNSSNSGINTHNTQNDQNTHYNDYYLQPNTINDNHNNENNTTTNNNNSNNNANKRRKFTPDNNHDDNNNTNNNNKETENDFTQPSMHTTLFVMGSSLLSALQSGVRKSISSLFKLGSSGSGGSGSSNNNNNNNSNVNNDTNNTINNKKRKKHFINITTTSSRRRKMNNTTSTTANDERSATLHYDFG